MSISIYQADQIESISDQLLQLMQATTNPAELKSQISNLLTDQLYQPLNQVTLGTLLTELVPNQAPTPASKSSQSTTAQTTLKSTPPVEATVNDTKETKTTPSKAIKKATGQSKESAVAEVDLWGNPVDFNDAPVTNTPPTPAEQYAALGNAKSGVLTYHDTIYPFIVKDLTKGPAKGEIRIIVKYQIPEQIKQVYLDQPSLQAVVNGQLKQLNRNYQGQTPTNCSLKDNLLFTLATPATLNDLMADLDQSMHLLTDVAQGTLNA